MHPLSVNNAALEGELIVTKGVNFPVPYDFTEESMSLLDIIASCSNDDLLKMKPINRLLMKKWFWGGKKFFFIQFSLFMVLITCMAISFSKFEISEKVHHVCEYVALALNTYFFFYECLQIRIQGFSYLTDFWNVMDAFRLGLSFTALIIEIVEDHSIQDYPEFILPVMFLLCWIKVMLSYLGVF